MSALPRFYEIGDRVVVATYYRLTRSIGMERATVVKIYDDIGYVEYLVDGKTKPDSIAERSGAIIKIS
jgi:hypothetical protein